MSMDPEQAERERVNREREEELRAIPLQKIDKSKWPRTVRPFPYPTRSRVPQTDIDLIIGRPGTLRTV